MSLDPGLLEILACPEDKGPLYYFQNEEILYNNRLGRTYSIRENIPVLIIEEAETLSQQDRERLDQIISQEKLSPTFEAVDD
tara:strand:+ start:370 stop:615 length:246 start_codon:yes stop_codon:yes gene_type:complete